MSDMDAMKTLVRRAIKLSDWAASEGLCPAGYADTDQEERNPEEFFFAYSTATGDEDWNGLPDRVFARIAALEAENAKLRAALIEASTRMKNARSACESNQVIDKDVHGTLTRGMFEISEALGD